MNVVHVTTGSTLGSVTSDGVAVSAKLLPRCPDGVRDPVGTMLAAKCLVSKLLRAANDVALGELLLNSQAFDSKENEVVLMIPGQRAYSHFPS